MRFSPVGVFKFVVVAIFIVIVAFCTFRNYMPTETLKIVHDYEETSANQTSAPAEPEQTNHSKSVTSFYSEPEIIPTESVTEISTSQERADNPSVIQYEPPADAKQTSILPVEQTTTVSDVVSTTQITENSRIININTATAAQLKTLSGIGDARAQAIIDYRELHGDFTCVDDLILVSGIGEKTLEKIRNDITV